MSSRTIRLFRISAFFGATCRIMRIQRTGFLSGHRINILTAKLFFTVPAPRPTATSTNHKFSTGFKSACKNIITSSIFETPTTTPGTLFRIIHPLRENCILCGFCHRYSHRFCHRYSSAFALARDCEILSRKHITGRFGCSDNRSRATYFTAC